MRAWAWIASADTFLEQESREIAADAHPGLLPKRLMTVVHGGRLSEIAMRTHRRCWILTRAVRRQDILEGPKGSCGKWFASPERAWHRLWVFDGNSPQLLSSGGREWPPVCEPHLAGWSVRA